MIAYGNIIARLMLKDDATWERHANPLSFWTRVVIAPLLVITIWSRVWIGWWCLLPLALLIVWIWLNPRIFRKPARTDNWASKAVFGERVWLHQKNAPIPNRHARMAHMLNGAAAVGAAIAVWGLVILEVWMTIVGLTVTVGAKMWFLDRMVWLYDDMRKQHPHYNRWLRS